MKDLVVVGAGPAGSVCAMHAARAGLDVMVVDKAQFPRFKSCGGALSRRTLKNLGSRASKAVNCEATGLVAYSPGLRRVVHDVHEPAYFVVRREWDYQVLLDAQDAGAEAVTGTTVKDVRPHDDTVDVVLGTGDTVASRYVVLADGTGLKSYRKRLGFTQPYEYMARTVCTETPVDERVVDEITQGQHRLHIFFGIVPRGYGWLFPKKGYLNVGIGFGNEHPPGKNQFEVFDDFVRLLKGRGMLPEDFDTAPKRPAAIPFKRPFEPTGIGHVLLAGDAGGFVSPVTGEGLYYGTTTGRLAAETIRDSLDEALDTGIVESYRQRWMDDFGRDMTGAGLSLADTVYKSTRRMELVVRLMTADEVVRRVTAEAILGYVTYGEARSQILRRAPWALVKSLRV